MMAARGGGDVTGVALKGLDDAYCVRDQALILPLGLAVGAKAGSKKKKRGM
mgnify:CR=1 FL=1